MVFLTIFALLQSIIFVAFGADPPFTFQRTIYAEQLPPSQVYPGAVSVFPNIKQDIVVTLSENCEDPKNQPNSPFIMNPSASQPPQLPFSDWASRLCKEERLLQKYFAYSFKNSIKASKKLLEAFQVDHFDAKSLSSYFYNLVLKSETAINGPHPEISAKVVSDAVEVNFHKLKTDGLLQVYASGTADQLFYKGYLNPENVAYLAGEYYRFTEARINCIKNPTPEENISAGSASFVDFLKSVGLYNPYTTAMVTAMYASQFYAL